MLSRFNNTCRNSCVSRKNKQTNVIRYRMQCCRCCYSHWLLFCVFQYGRKLTINICGNPMGILQLPRTENSTALRFFNNYVLSDVFWCHWISSTSFTRTSDDHQCHATYSLFPSLFICRMLRWRNSSL